MKLNSLVVGLSLILAGCGQEIIVSDSTKTEYSAELNSETMTEMSAEKRTDNSTDPSLCQFNQSACQQNAIGLKISPFNAPSEQPLELTLSMPEGYRINKASISGRDMYMGQIPVNFDKTGKAQAIYGSCATDYMVWRLTVELTSGRGKIETRHFDWLADAKPAPTL